MKDETTKKVFIIGGVAAGPKTASRLKRLKPEYRVTVVDQDSLISYGGCGIPYYVSGDVNDEVQLRQTSFHITRDADFFSKAKGVDVHTRTRALAIDRKRKTVQVEHLDSGEKRDLPYDKLVLATGSRPKIPPIPGANLPNVFTVTDLHKAVAIKELLTKGKVGRAVIIGGGFIGVEVAGTFADLWGGWKRRSSSSCRSFCPISSIGPSPTFWPLFCAATTSRCTPANVRAASRPMPMAVPAG